MDACARRVLVSGDVQGVGFRYFVAREAARLELNGWVRNLPDGRVEVEAEGSADRFGELESALRLGPPHARVAEVQVNDISDEIEPRKTFEIK